jgi:5-methyltetrahydrofolate--homocysteine methyltransferase
MADLSALTAAVEAGDRKTAVSLTQEAIDAGTDPTVILDAMTVAMTEVGRKFACNEGVYVPEMLISAHAMKESSVLLEPLLAASGVTPEFTAVIGTVQGDLHDIGKNLVGIMLEGAGFEVVDLGIDVPPEKFIEAAIAEDASVIGLSSLLTTTMDIMKGVVNLVGERGLSDKVQVIVGGAPLSEEFAQSIGAQGYAYDAANAVEKVMELVEGD